MVHDVVNFTVSVIKFEFDTENKPDCALIEFMGRKMWVDISSEEDDIILEWNKWIFHLHDPNDVIDEFIQEQFPIDALYDIIQKAISEL